MAFIPNALTANITTDQSSLLSLKSHASLSHHHILAKNWSTNTSVCDWIAVVCGSKHHRVVVLDISSMGLVGTLPPQLGNLSFLVSLNLSHNSFHGNLPRELANLRRLKFLDFSYNDFSGKIPEEIGNLENVRNLILEFNQLEGPIPFTILNIFTLQLLSLMNNNLSGPLPMNLCQHPSRLKALCLSFNKLNGDIPNSLSACSELEELLLDNNNFAGMVPREIGNLTMLKFLHLGSNYLEGEIPKELGKLDELEELKLDENELSGFIQWEIFNISSLTDMTLASNYNLSGPISDCLGNVSSLREVYLFKNEFTFFPPTLWSHENLLMLELYSNNLSGSLPQEIGNAKTAIHIYLSNNKLSGQIPLSIGGLTEIINFSVAHNTIHGSIPDAFGKLLDLHLLDLSDNKISGMIPKSLEGLVSLKYFNVSYNKLIGEIPSGGAFANFTYESFLSNDGLCGSPRMHVPPCPANSLRTSKKSRVVMFVLISLAVLIVLVVSVTVYLIFKRRKKVIPREPYFLSTVTPARFSYYELQRATNGFDDSNLLGSGSFGSVYKGTLTNGMHVATKVFHLLHEGENKSFDIECEVLRNILHRNLKKVLGSCSNLDFKALVLEYMPNGSLHKWLYSHNYFLNIIQRLSIMIDVASALEYLHFGYSEPVIHCDLKPNNVLIDADMVGHLSDFGAAKLLGDENSMAFTNSLTTIGYIAPEYGREGLVSTRSDMYSYGIMLLEVFTRTQPGDEMFNEDSSLRSWVQNAFPTEIGHVIDPNLLGLDEERYAEKLQCVIAIFEMGMKCSTDSPRERMVIKDALPALEKIKVTLLSLYART
ncbi:receptor kinase-like protein Xa21 [Ipomoea triloba]|uniref:receptor kinase-like protein Xa21 n=1 Tax=Ipomoea triloba TaxID=35885 RepID=UPI00125D3722|nr:receptor kinase-like protein Xa21 [Ipomoea triloba]